MDLQFVFNFCSASTEIRMVKGSKKSRRRRAQEEPADVDQAEPAQAAQAPQAVDGKNLLELSADELKKEAFKLGLFTEGERPRKEQALTKLTAFLSRSGINIETFVFTPNGATQFPAPLLTQNRAKVTRTKTGSSSNSESGSSTEEDEISLANTAPSTLPSVRRKKKTKANKTSTSNSNYGYETLVNPVTGVPVGIVSRTTGQFFSVAIPGSPPVQSIPTLPPASPHQLPTGAHTPLSQTGLVTGLDLGGNVAHTAGQPWTGTTGMRGNENIDICGISVPGFAANKTQHNTSNCSKKITSGMFCTGKKEVRQKIVWPHHCVNSIIKPNGVEYDVMNWQELTNGFTGLILSKLDNATTQPDVVNMLRHLNLISGYGMFAPMKTVLDFNAGLMMGIENMSQDWGNWARLKQYHDQHLHSLKLSTNVADAHAQSVTKPHNDTGHGSVGNHNNGGGPGGSQRCSKTWLTSQNVCFLYQNDKCDQEMSHDDGKGNTLCHCCGWCYYNWKGIMEHSNSLCPDKKNPFRSSQGKTAQ